MHTDTFPGVGLDAMSVVGLGICPWVDWVWWVSLVVYWYTNSGLIRYRGPTGSDRGPTVLTELVEITERPNGPTCDGMKVLSIYANHETS